MKQVFQWLMRIAYGASLLISLMFFFFWVRSNYVGDSFRHVGSTIPSNTIDLFVSLGVIRFERRIPPAFSFPISQRPRWIYRVLQPPMILVEPHYRGERLLFHRCGIIVWELRNVQGITDQTWGLNFPCWLPFLLFLLPPICWLVLYRRQRRSTPGGFPIA
jgi:hypothetical protein